MSDRSYLHSLDEETQRSILNLPEIFQVRLAAFVQKRPSESGENLGLRVREEIDCLLKGRPLRAQFDPRLADVSLYAPEDTAMNLVTIRGLLRRLSTRPFLLDLCTGSSVVPSQLSVDDQITGFVGVDVDTGTANAFREQLDASLTAKGSILAFDLEADDLGQLKSHLPENDAVLISSNPPWVPSPPGAVDLEDKNRLAIDGGRDGLRYYGRIFEAASQLGVERLCLNLPSIVRIPDFIRLMQTYDFGLEHVNALHTYSYGFDARPEIRRHIQSLSGNVYREEGGRMRYLLMGLALKKGWGSDSGLYLERLLKTYEVKGFNQMNKDLEALCELYRLSNEDEARILDRL